MGVVALTVQGETWRLERKKGARLERDNER